MLSETALKLAEAGTESCRVGVVALPLPPLPPTPSPLVSTGRQWKEKDKAEALKKRATAQQPFVKDDSFNDSICVRFLVFCRDGAIC